jgi:hypothetical protein
MLFYLILCTAALSIGAIIVLPDNVTRLDGQKINRVKAAGLLIFGIIW